ncbi:Teneurin-3 [Hondaea fermentalgiana]|uniref:Teneurin-3 n=1 Tax=Hondaea fermentalgiana TaxID=2315210 RepID=A0A2R5GRA6_9STRA|nr:Teneurin-3 [Hondaea fermentalgiana]|eukprot:GBG33412.1 Teneurin-3 [Hondaea fermentalgiana]
MHKRQRRAHDLSTADHGRPESAGVSASAFGTRDETSRGASDQARAFHDLYLREHARTQEGTSTNNNETSRAPVAGLSRAPPQAAAAPEIIIDSAVWAPAEIFNPNNLLHVKEKRPFGATRGNTSVPQVPALVVRIKAEGIGRTENLAVRAMLWSCGPITQQARFIEKKGIHTLAPKHGEPFCSLRGNAKIECQRNQQQQQYRMETGLQAEAVESKDEEEHRRFGRKCTFPRCEKASQGPTAYCISHGGGKKCGRENCDKLDKGGGFCVSHGGGKRCQVPDCERSAKGPTAHCIAHGGGSRCKVNRCAKLDAGKGFCIAHGGGKRCSHENCNKAAQGSSGLCKAHGGGRTCKFEGCLKRDMGGGYCIAHGGGKRCEVEGCEKSAQGGTKCCVRHGGGKRCREPECTKSAAGSTKYCIRHGGGRRCKETGCSKHATGGGFCAEHGGGRRCNVQGCDNNALYGGIKGFCYSHGGGKRCREPNCNKAPRVPTEYCVSHGGGVRCKADNCTSLARSGGLCGTHGGRKRCVSVNCQKFAKYGGLCKAHGGGKRCREPRCTRFERANGLCQHHLSPAAAAAAAAAGNVTPKCDDPGCDRPALMNDDFCRVHSRLPQTAHILPTGMNISPQHVGGDQPGNSDHQGGASAPGPPGAMNDYEDDEEIDAKLRDLQRQMSILEAAREERIKRRRLSAPTGPPMAHPTHAPWGGHQFSSQAAGPGSFQPHHMQQQQPPPPPQQQQQSQQDHVADGYGQYSSSTSGTGI